MAVPTGRAAIFFYFGFAIVSHSRSLNELEHIVDGAPSRVRSLHKSESCLHTLICLGKAQQLCRLLGERSGCRLEPFHSVGSPGPFPTSRRPKHGCRTATPHCF